MKGYKYGDGFAIKPLAEMLPGETMIAYCGSVAGARCFADSMSATQSRHFPGARFTVADLYGECDGTGRAVVDLRDDWHRQNT